MKTHVPSSFDAIALQPKLDPASAGGTLPAFLLLSS